MDIDFGRELIQQFGAMGILGYAAFRTLRMAERITDSIVGAFESQKQTLKDIHAAIEALQDDIHAASRAVVKRIQETESNIIQITSGSSPRVPR